MVSTEVSPQDVIPSSSAVPTDDAEWNKAALEDDDYPDTEDDRSQLPRERVGRTSAEPQDYTADELLQSAPLPVVWAWPGFVQKRAINLLVGVAEAYKSWVCLYLAICWATGRVPFTEDEEAPPGKVLYVAGETRVRDGVEHRRLRALCKGHGFGPSVPNLIITAARGFSVADGDWLNRKLKKHQPDHVIFDSVAALSGIEDENSNTLVRIFLRDYVYPMVETYPDLTFLGLHHSGKPPMGKDGKTVAVSDERTARGASSWRDGVDAQVYLRPTNRETGEFAVRAAKTREGKRPPFLAIQLVADDPLTTARLELRASGDAAKDQSSMRQALTATPQTLEDLMKASGLKRSAAQVALKNLGPTVAKSGSGVKGDPSLYALADFIVKRESGL